jgi:hypothetical protein
MFWRVPSDWFKRRSCLPRCRFRDLLLRGIVVPRGITRFTSPRSYASTASDQRLDLDQYYHLLIPPRIRVFGDWASPGLPLVEIHSPPPLRLRHREALVPLLGWSRKGRYTSPPATTVHHTKLPGGNHAKLKRAGCYFCPHAQAPWAALVRPYQYQ